MSSIKSIHFKPYPDCENDLIGISSIGLLRLAAREPDGFSEISKRFGTAKFQSRAEQILNHLKTDLKIHVNQLRANIPASPTPNVAVVETTIPFKQGDSSTIRTRVQLKPEKVHWTTTPMLWLTVLILIAGAIVATPIVLIWFNHQAEGAR